MFWDPEGTRARGFCRSIPIDVCSGSYTYFVIGVVVVACEWLSTKSLPASRCGRLYHLANIYDIAWPGLPVTTQLTRTFVASDGKLLTGVGLVCPYLRGVRIICLTTDVPCAYTPIARDTTWTIIEHFVNAFATDISLPRSIQHSFMRMACLKWHNNNPSSTHVVCVSNASNQQSMWLPPLIIVWAEGQNSQTGLSGHTTKVSVSFCFLYEWVLLARCCRCKEKELAVGCPSPTMKKATYYNIHAASS